MPFAWHKNLSFVAALNRNNCVLANAKSSAADLHIADLAVLADAEFLAHAIPADELTRPDSVAAALMILSFSGTPASKIHSLER